jgi:hypothetical protein
MNESSIEITVLDFKLNRLPEARVALTPYGKRGKAVPLSYDPQQQLFRAGRLRPGVYVANVEADGLETEEREVEVAANGLRDRFILGVKGMPAYYRGRVRVPFEPTELIAASLRPQLKTQRPEAFDSFARELNLAPQKISADVENSFVSVFRLPDGASDEDRAVVLARMKDHPDVRHAGPVVGILHDSISFLTNEIVVRFKDHIDENVVRDLARRHRFDIIRTIPYAGNAFLFRTEEDDDYRVLGVCEELVRGGHVIYAEPNLVTTAVSDFHPNDSLLAQQTHHPIIGSEAAWNTTLGSHSIIIGVVDAGCDTAHPDLQAPAGAGWTKIYSPFDFIDMDTNPLALDHGSKSCGIATATANNTIGVAGLAPECKLLPVRKPDGSPDSLWADMYVWLAGFNPGSSTPGFPAAISPGADVISNSFGLSEPALPGVMKDAFDFVTTYGRGGKGCVVVFSAGNDNLDFTTYRQWAAYDKTIAVAASTLTPPDAGNEHKASSSNFGNKLDLCAPAGGAGIAGESRSFSSSNIGSGTTPSAPGGSLDYADFGQTSCACPQVSGTAALLLSLKPALTWVEVRQILRDTATKIDFANVSPVGHYIDTNADGVADYSQWYGFGRLNASAAVGSANGYAFNRDIVVRDNIADIGDVATASPWWGSSDLWVRKHDPAVDGAAALPAAYGDEPPHEEPSALHDNWIYVRFKNRGAAPSYDFYVRVYLAHWSGLEFLYPSNFIPTTRPSDPLPVPLVPGTYLIGEVHYTSLAAGADDHIVVRWPQAMIPPADVMVGGSPVHWHPCLLVEITPHDGPTPTGPNVWDDNNLAQRNVTIDYVNDDDKTFSALMVAGSMQSRQTLALEIDRGELQTSIVLSIDILDASTREKAIGLVEKMKPKGVSITPVTQAGDRHRFALDPKLGKVRLPLPTGGHYVPIVVTGTKTMAAKTKEAVIVVTQYHGKAPAGTAAIAVLPKPKK